MQLTLYTDYSLRVLLYVALKGEQTATISEIAEAYGVSRNHLVKVVHHLGKLGYLETTRGRSGGLALARDPADINVGEVVEAVEPTMDLVECFDMARNTCPIAPACRLKGVLTQANRAFLAVLKEYTLQDLLVSRGPMRKQLGLV